MHARRLIKQCQRAESKGKTLQNLERDLYVEELRQEKLRQSTDLLRELELAENPLKLRLLFKYKSLEK